MLSEEIQATVGRKRGSFFLVAWLRKKFIEEKVLEARLTICI